MISICTHEGAGVVLSGLGGVLDGDGVHQFAGDGFVVFQDRQLGGGCARGPGSPKMFSPKILGWRRFERHRMRDAR